MDPKIIEEKLNNYLELIKTMDIVKDYPKLKEAIEYLMYEYPKEIKTLSSGDSFRNGTKFTKCIINIYATLVAKYYEKVYGKELVIKNEEKYENTIVGGFYIPEDDEIKYSTMGILFSSINKNDLAFLYTFLHEACHKRQCDSFKADSIEELMKYPPYMIILAKEFVVLEDLKKTDIDYYEKFYNENYSNLYLEQEAFYSACKLMSRLLRHLYDEYRLYTLSTNNRDNEVIRSEQDRLTSDISRFSEETMYDYKDLGYMKGSILEEFLHDMPIESTFTSDGKAVDRMILIDKTIKAHPEIQMQYPIFKFLFNEFTPKTYDEIIEDRNRLKREYPAYSMVIHHLYNSIINSDPILYLSKIVGYKDVKAIHVFLTKHPKVLTEYLDDVNRLIDKCDDAEIVDILKSGILRAM